MTISQYFSLLYFLSYPLSSFGAGIGQWGPTIQFPLVPSAAAILPDTGELLTWSAYSKNNYGAGVSGLTQTAVYNPSNGAVTQYTVSNTGHDMFCPGVSIDFNGRVVVTGGDTANKTSIHNTATSDGWLAGGIMNIPRGYQSSTTVSDGRIFTIGGSWSGGYGGKNGEIFNPSTNSWSLLSGCTVAPMLTADAQGIFRQDNHAWLFAWKNGYVLQAGPSKAMNWYTTTGSGSQKSAGTRTGDGDAMNGNAVLYDAVAGEIATFGGSPSYQYSYATKNVHLITLPSTPGSNPTVQTLTSMSYARAFANAVALPDGKIFVVGGQTYAIPFSDGNSSLTPEMWNPTTQTFTKMAPLSTPRNYHSVALLLPDATVFNGGGGLCGTCTTNHLDGAIYSPPYLFGADGKTKATRPTIASVSATTVAVGGKLSVKVTGSVTTFSLIRIGSNTHTVNTDQRRVPLTPSGSGGNLTVTLPGDAGVVLPGYWYLFAVDSSGVPSVAKTVKVTL
ncbi:MAG: hypothetical protein Q9227_007780 [Pyrenula ochraceoflavens]